MIRLSAAKFKGTKSAKGQTIRKVIGGGGGGGGGAFLACMNSCSVHVLRRKFFAPYPSA